MRAYGEVMGSAEAIHWGRLANTYVPELRTHDRFGSLVWIGALPPWMKRCWPWLSVLSSSADAQR